MSPSNHYLGDSIICPVTQCWGPGWAPGEYRWQPRTTEPNGERYDGQCRQRYVPCQSKWIVRLQCYVGRYRRNRNDGGKCLQNLALVISITVSVLKRVSIQLFPLFSWLNVTIKIWTKLVFFVHGYCLCTVVCYRLRFLISQSALGTLSGGHSLLRRLWSKTKTTTTVWVLCKCYEYFSDRQT